MIVVTVRTTAAYSYLCLKDENGKEQFRTRIHSLFKRFCDVFSHRQVLTTSLIISLSTNVIYY